jgi:hypothetical protein
VKRVDLPLRSNRLGDSTKNKREGAITKRYDEPIDVSAADLEWGPAGFVWRGRRYEVDRPLATWREATHTRNGNKNGRGQNGYVDKSFFRLLARPASSLATGDLDSDGYIQHVSGAVYDVYLDPIRNEWRLARIWD